MVTRLVLIGWLALATGCQKKIPEAPPRIDQLEAARKAAAEPGVNQTLEQVRLASIAMAEGEDELAEKTLRQAVGRMQDFRADGQFRATVGAEDRKEWKGDPYEKMMAFFYLGVLLASEGDYGNALAMGKSAILADTGTSKSRFRSDFVPGYLLQAIAFVGLGELGNAEQKLDAAVDAMYVRAYTEHLSGLLNEVELSSEDAEGIAAARVLLLAALPAGLDARPRDPEQAIRAARSRATDLRSLALDGKRKDWPADLSMLRRGPLKRSLEHLEGLTLGWKRAAEGDRRDIDAEVASTEATYRELLREPSLMLWVETGRGPTKIATGEWAHILQVVPSNRPGGEPQIQLNDQPIGASYADSVTWQATTRGSRGVDGFLKGKAVFKDAAPALGFVLYEAGEIARYADQSGDGTVGTILQVAALATWVAGAATNPEADTRTWEDLPDALWLVTADPEPGRHQLRVDGRAYNVDIPDTGSVLRLIPGRRPFGPIEFGTPCSVCETKPLALPASPPDGETP